MRWLKLTDIRKILVWREDRQEYLPPLRGKLYMARRWEVNVFGQRDRRSETFSSLEEAKRWEGFADSAPSPSVTPIATVMMDDGGPLFREVIERWRNRRSHTLAVSTRFRYEDLIRRTFTPLMDIAIRKITTAIIDEWVGWLIGNKDQYGRGTQRRSFKHELQLLKTVLNYYREYEDDPKFTMPVKRRHGDDVKLRNRSRPAKKDLQEHELHQFISALRRQSMGDVLAALATAQFHQALRISEVAALDWTDVVFDETDPSRSVLYFRRHVIYVRGPKELSFIEHGFKNSDSMDGVKVHPMLPEVHAALKSLQRQGGSGLVFRNGEGSFFTYRQLQAAFNRAFKAAGLPYTSTHVMRHGGTRKTLEETGGDRDVAQQQLGNRDRRTVDLYAVRSALVFTEYAKGQWNKSREANGTGSNWQHSAPALKLL